MRLNHRFNLQEYVSKSAYLKYGDQSSRFICPTLLEVDLLLCKLVEAELGHAVSCTINNWSTGGDRVASGLRMVGEPHYSITSSHAWGRGSDKQFSHKETKARIANNIIYNVVLNNQGALYLAGMRRIEHIDDAPTWLHSDTLWTPDEFVNKIQVVRAK
jgi:hypothetical protein